MVSATPHRPRVNCVKRCFARHAGQPQIKTEVHAASLKALSTGQREAKAGPCPFTQKPCTPTANLPH